MPATRGPVIVVDDDAAVRNSLKFALEVEGLQVRAYPGGQALLADPDLPRTGCLVVDYYMPGMNGVDLVRSLRTRQVDWPAILITARADDAMRATAARAGIGLVLEKPLGDASLMEGIRGALAGAA